MRRRILAVLVLSGLTLGMPGPAIGQVTESEAIARIRHLENRGDHEGAYDEAKALLQRFPQSAALRALWLTDMNLVGMHEAAARIADSLAIARPDDPWAQRAVALIEGKQKEVVALMQRVRSEAPWDPDELTTTAEALCKLGGNGPARALTMLDSALSRGVRTSGVLAAKAAGIVDPNYAPNLADNLTPRAVELAREAIRADSTDVRGYVALATALQRLGDNAGYYSAYRRAARQAPLSADLHRDYWVAVERRGGKEADVEQEILADLRAMVAGRPDSGYGLLLAADELDKRNMPAAADSLRVRVLVSHPDSHYAEQVYLRRIDRLERAASTSSNPDNLRHEEVELLRAYVSRSVHHSPRELATRNGDLFSLLLRDSTAGREELERTGDAALKSGGPDVWFAHEAAIGLADHVVGLDLAERFARDIPRRAALQDSVRRQAGFRQLTSRAVDDLHRNDLAAMHDALGWVRFRQDRVDEAERELKPALEAAPKAPWVLYHAARIAEGRGQMDDAERLYTRGYSAELGGSSRDNERALRRLNAARGGSEDGLQMFISVLQEKIRPEWRRRVLASRLKTQRPLPAFRLARLEGDTLSSAALAGKVVILNFWGVWCGGCVAELPHIQKVFDSYRADPNVVFLTIDCDDPDIERVRQFVSRRSLRLPVLRDDGYAARVRVLTFPTTWFIGKDGRIAFEVVGASDEASMVQEFGWRIEALKADR